HRALDRHRPRKSPPAAAALLSRRARNQHDRRKRLGARGANAAIRSRPNHLGAKRPRLPKPPPFHCVPPALCGQFNPLSLSVPSVLLSSKLCFFATILLENEALRNLRAADRKRPIGSCFYPCSSVPSVVQLVRLWLRRQPL